MGFYILWNNKDIVNDKIYTHIAKKCIPGHLTF